ncbi:MAG: hypothetical protein J7539_02810 [Niabella sp.]|nr:hypothetical protein [Niabella sp.]
MKVQGNHFIIAIVCLGLDACSGTNPRYISNPSMYNAAFFRQKGDLKVSGAFVANPNNLLTSVRLDTATKDEANKNMGFDGQIAYAVTDHFLIQGGGMYRSEKDIFNHDDIAPNSGSQINYKRSQFDIGAGYYTAMGTSRKVFFNGVLSAGFGHSTSADIGTPNERRRYFDFNFVKYQLTPSVNFFFTENARLSLAPRFSLLTANNFNTNYTAAEQEQLNYNTMGKGRLLFEPGMLFQGGAPGLPWLKFEVGAHFSSNPLTAVSESNGTTGFSDSDRRLRSRRFLLSLGLSFYPFEGRHLQ